MWISCIIVFGTFVFPQRFDAPFIVPRHILTPAAAAWFRIITAGYILLSV